ncbi:MAG TPA: adenylate/guanylate cyclase domain-containing protein [Rhodothermales bacterium]|nr:adenylate/guanylate cyclase domain-containing protein [Rhodothermales bacterium]
MSDAPVKILVVDDEPDLESLVQMKFRKQIRNGTLHFQFAGDGQEALEKLDADPDIDIVLTDINMPRMDGLKLLAEINNLDRMLRSIVVSAYGDMDNIRRAMNQGAFDFLVKPIELDDLEATVEKTRVNVEQLKKATQMRRTFGRYVSDEVVEALMEDPEALQLGGEKRKVTMLMSDLRGFSTTAERLPPEEVVEILNTFLGRMAEVITQYQGTINEFIGDAIFVIFGAPIPRENDAQRAVACAVHMQQAMSGVNEEVADMKITPLEMGIGIHTGEVVVGNIGSEKRMKYGAVGSHVNLTSRIETYTVGGQILISKATLEEAGSTVEIGEQLEVAAKGMTQPMKLYAVDAIGDPYNLKVPVQEEKMRALDEPLPFEFSILDGKHLSGPKWDGEIIALSSLGATIRTENPPKRLDNLKMSLSMPDEPAEMMGDLYAKVMGEGKEDGGLQVRFTAVPPDVAEAFKQVV